MRLKRRKRRKKCKRKEEAENNGKYKIQGSKYKKEKSGKKEEKIRVLWKLIKREKGRKFRTDKRGNCTCGYRDGRTKKLKARS